MLGLIAAWVIAQAPAPATAPKAAVIDISAPDAVYEDVSRALAEQLASALRSAGFEAVRVDLDELPESGCRAGPCLGVVAKQKNALVLVALDASEVEDSKKTQVAVTGMFGLNGQPLAGVRYVAKEGSKKPPKELLGFAQKLFSAAKKAQAEIEAVQSAKRTRDAPDAGH